MREINTIIQREYEYLSRQYTVLGVFLYGSQNYGLSTPSSDVDTKAIVVPSLHDLISNQPVSRIIPFKYGSCDIKDIREMIANYKKQNVNYIETLFTKHFFVAPEFAHDFDALRARREAIARLDEARALACMNGLLKQSIKRMQSRTEATAEDIDKYGYHRKSLMNAFKSADMIEKYTNGQLYRDVLNCNRLSILRENVYTKDTALSAAKGLDLKCAATTRTYLSNAQPTPNTELTRWLDDWVFEIIRMNIPL